VASETVEQQLLEHAERQTKALESVRGMVFLWSLLGLVALVVLLIAWMAGAGILA
jgi:hypothetical protein